MSSLNQVQLIGNLGKDPTIKTVGSGDKVANFSMAMTEKWTKDGEKKERTEWANIVVWGALAGVIEKYVKKGSKLMIQGQLRTRKYDKDGRDVYVTEVVLQGPAAKLIMLDGKSGGSQSDAHEPDYRAGTTGATESKTTYEIDDEIPF